MATRSARDAPAARTPAELGFGRLFDEMSDAIVVAGTDGRIVLWNAAATRLFGYEMSEVVGRDIDLLVPQHLKGSHHAGISGFAKTGHGRFIDSGRPMELPAQHKDGHQLYVDLTLSCVESRGEPFVLALIRDVDERVRLRDAAAHHQREVEAANESLEAFSYVVGHDLKEPVRAMGAYFEEIAASPPGSDREELIARAAEAHASLDRLLQGLLEWSRMSMTPIEPELLRIQEVLTTPGACAQFAPLVTERGAKLEIADDIPPVLATESLLVRVFGNLITNAIRHNPRSDPVVRISAGTSAPPGLVEVLVTDNGPGFPAAIKERVRKFRHRPATLKGGFGLSITHRAVERLGGALYLDDAPSGGGVARVHLPAPSKRPRDAFEDRARSLI